MKRDHHDGEETSQNGGGKRLLWTGRRERARDVHPTHRHVHRKQTEHEGRCQGHPEAVPEHLLQRACDDLGQ
jgi:hypothetical protein